MFVITPSPLDTVVWIVLATTAMKKKSEKEFLEQLRKACAREKIFSLQASYGTPTTNQSMSLWH